MNPHESFRGIACFLYVDLDVHVVVNANVVAVVCLDADDAFVQAHDSDYVYVHDHGQVQIQEVTAMLGRFVGIHQGSG
jgi:hypothetical protein